MITILLILVALLLPIIPINEPFLGYYGSILGAIIGVLGAYIILSTQLNQDKESFNKTQIDNTFFNLLNLFKEVKTPIPQKIFRKLLGTIESRYKTQAQNKSLTEYKNELLSILNTEKVSKIGKESGRTRHLEQTKYYVKNSQFFYFSESLTPLLYLPEKIQEFNTIFDIRDRIQETPNYNFLTSKDKEKFISEIFSYPKYFQELSNYLLLFHRIVKFIINSELEISEKKEYLGILRALLSPNELLVIFYNIFYSNNGTGLSGQFKSQHKNEYTEFFASAHDIKIFNKNIPDIEDKIDLPFFSYDELIFKDEDLLLIKSLIDPNKLN